MPEEMWRPLFDVNLCATFVTSSGASQGGSKHYRSKDILRGKHGDFLIYHGQTGIFDGMQMAMPSRGSICSHRATTRHRVLMAHGRGGG